MNYIRFLFFIISSSSWAAVDLGQCVQVPNLTAYQCEMPDALDPLDNIHFDIQFHTQLNAGSLDYRFNFLSFKVTPETSLVSGSHENVIFQTQYYHGIEKQNRLVGLLIDWQISFDTENADCTAPVGTAIPIPGEPKTYRLLFQKGPELFIQAKKVIQTKNKSETLYFVRCKPKSLFPQDFIRVTGTEVPKRRKPQRPNLENFECATCPNGAGTPYVSRNEKRQWVCKECSVTNKVPNLSQTF